MKDILEYYNKGFIDLLKDKTIYRYNNDNGVLNTIDEEMIGLSSVSLFMEYWIKE